MKSDFYINRWYELKKAEFNPEDLARLSGQIAHSFLDAYLKDCHYESEYIDLLCEMMTFSADSRVNSIAAAALFGIIIERLCDEFEALQTETYNRVMTQVIDYSRKLPSGRELDRSLKEFSIHSREDLLERLTKIRINGNIVSRFGDVRKILLLSRVTIGADVAITSVIIQRLSKLFPEAQIVLIGAEKLAEIYGGNSRINIKAVDYNRRGGFLERLSSWHAVLEIIQAETSATPPEKTILVDPDSRLSQLGVLPLVPLDHYFFFDSRSDISLNSKMSMAELTNAWLNKITGFEDFHYPKIWPQQSNIDTAAGLCQRLRKNGARNIICVNFGVGGNLRKKVGPPLEEKLLLNLLDNPQTVILLDRGFGEDEFSYTRDLLDRIKAKGFAAYNHSFGADIDDNLNWGIAGIQTRIGEIAAIIASADEYIGYDSACQHIAAALGTPCLTIFAGSNNMRFIRRWSAFGPSSHQIVHVDTLNNPSTIDIDDIITRIMNERRIQRL